MKKIKRILSCALLICISIITYAQASDIRIEWSDQIEGSNPSGSSFKGLGWHGGDYYTIQTKYNLMGQLSQLFLDKVSNSSASEFNKELDVNYISPNGFTVQNNDEFLYVDLDSDNSKTDVFVYQFDYNAERKKKTKVKTFTKEKGKYNKGSLFSSYYGFGSSTEHSESPDKSTISLCNISYGKGTNPSRIEVVNFNKTNILDNLSYTHTLDASLFSVYIVKQQIDNEGNLVILIAEQKSKKEEAEIYAYTFDKDGTFLGRTLLNYQDYYFAQPTLLTTTEGKVKIGGLYYEKIRKNSLYKGYFLADFNPLDQSFSNFEISKFDQGLLNRYGKKVKDGKVKIQGNYTFKMVESKNGGGYIIGERKYIQSSNNSNGSTRSRYSYYSVDLLVSQFNTSNKLSETKMILKNQVSASPNSYFSGYFAFEHDGVLHVYFNGIDNDVHDIELEKLSKMLNPQSVNAAVIHYTLDNQNELSKSVEFYTEEKEGYLIPEACSWTNEKTMFYLGWGEYRKFGVFKH